MNLINIKVGDRFLEMDKASVRIERLSGLIYRNAGPGLYSFPFEIPDTEPNRLALGFPDMMDNAEPFIAEVECQIYLRENFWFKALLSVEETFTKSISCIIVPGDSVTVGQWLSKNLRNIDFGDYNQYFLPETYRYVIGSFDFNVAVDPIQISVGLSFSSFTTYYEAANVDPDVQVANLLAQINADTATHKCVATLLLKIPDSGLGPTFPRYWVLFKSTNQFDFEPQKIGGSGPLEVLNFTTLISNVNDPTSGQSNIANHMKWSTLSTFKTIYEIAFGETKWRFPMVYNPDFYDDESTTYDHFINTYKHSTTSFLTQPLTGAQFNKSVPNYPALPFPLVSFVLKYIFADSGIRFETTFFNDGELAELILMNLYSWEKLGDDETVLMGNSNFDLRKAMPDMPVSEFLDGFATLFFLIYDYDLKVGKVRMRKLKDVLNDRTYIDRTNQVVMKKPLIQKYEVYKNGYTLSFEWDSADNYVGEKIADLSEYYEQDAVDMIADLPTSGNKTGDIRLVRSVNAFYVVDTSVTPNTWSFISLNYRPYVHGNGETEISTSVTPMLDIIDPEQKTGVGTFATLNIKTPCVKQIGNSVLHKVGYNPFGARICFYRGMRNAGTSPGGTYPMAGSDEYDYASTSQEAETVSSPFTYSLRWDGAKGLREKFGKEVLSFYALTRRFEFDFLMPENDLLNFDIYKHLRVENTDFIPGKITIILDNKTNALKPVRVELYKR